MSKMEHTHWDTEGLFVVWNLKQQLFWPQIKFWTWAWRIGGYRKNQFKQSDADNDDFGTSKISTTRSVFHYPTIKSRIHLKKEASEGLLFYSLISQPVSASGSLILNNKGRGFIRILSRSHSSDSFRWFTCWWTSKIMVSSWISGNRRTSTTMMGREVFWNRVWKSAEVVVECFFVRFVRPFAG